MRYFITYGDDKFKISRERICRQATDMNIFDSVKYFTPLDIDDSFKEKIGKYWNERRGGGLWLWKPYIIYKTLEKLNDGDFLVYCDSGSHLDKKGRLLFLKYLSYLNEKCCVQFTDRFLEKDWTVNEIYEYFKIEKDNSLQNSAGCQIIKKCSESMKLFGEWYRIAFERPDLFSQDYVISNRRDNSKFQDNRHDQSIISILSKLPEHKDSIYFLSPEHLRIKKNILNIYYPILALRDKQ